LGVRMEKDVVEVPQARWRTRALQRSAVNRKDALAESCRLLHLPGADFGARRGRREHENHRVGLADQVHAKALHGNPYDGHTLGPVSADLEKLTGATVRRIHGDKGYRGHNYPNRFKVWISGQVRRVTKAIRREMRRRAAIEPVIGHLKEDHRMGRNYLTGRDGDRINAVLAAA